MIKIARFMFYDSVKFLLTAFGLFHLHGESFALTNFLYFNPTPLAIGNEHVTKFFFFFDSVEIINYDTNKQINDKLTADNHE